MTAVERLVQQLGRDIALAGGTNAAAVQNVIRRRLRIDIADFRQHLPQLHRRQACADDGAMEHRRQFPGFQALSPDRYCGGSRMLFDDRKRKGPFVIEENRHVRTSVIFHRILR